MNQRVNIELGDAGAEVIEARQFKVYTHRQLDKIEAIQNLPEDLRFDMRVVSQVLPFRVNEYVIEELIDWSDVPADPVFQLTFPQRGMLRPEHYDAVAELVRRDADAAEMKPVIERIRAELNPHPAGQMDLNLPLLDGEPLPGMQHKYRETVLFFPSQGQVCHSYCTFCFRWAQFVGDKTLKFAASEAESLHRYLAEHTEVTDLLMTGGDPMVMKAKHLRMYLEGLMAPELDHVQDIRIGSKSLTFWPYRFVTDPDADDVLALFRELTAAGKHVAFMAHFNHWKEMDTPICREAIRRIRATGAEIRTQAPLLRHINDDADQWARMWTTQVRLGMIPYYMFVERDTGARHYFEVPLVRAWEIYREAMQRVPGLARTARGPSMSADPGKVEIQGVTEIHGEKVFVLRFIQGREAGWVQRPFFARYDETATWLNHLEPALGESEFFYEAEFVAMKRAKRELIASAT
ncbi:KamA family radical SAM protein [Billgrantia desiderata]|uniref:Lysine 2,3-aminomutase n=1 Tax=Billgrantia desiderata TaxID=52021 RepID=A0AAW4YTT0_9GAMM|nr:lysine 2,3-aminomutase [Halomonas desiderata]MCE8029133.1 lysine 2,3-aminomutase [Halomonas desiderata]MCE8051808.1 lysine 2,3-aminomutase [Halomonas desiderata]SEG00448.1 L-lysine 2,3-aminomutase [Halomonas desiderata]